MTKDPKAMSLDELAAEEKAVVAELARARDEKAAAEARIKALQTRHTDVLDEQFDRRLKGRP